MEDSFIPATCIMDIILRTDAGDSTWSPDSGQRPPLANEAAMTAPDSQVTSVDEHCWGRKKQFHTSEREQNRTRTRTETMKTSVSCSSTCCSSSNTERRSTFSGKHWSRGEEGTFVQRQQRRCLNPQREGGGSPSSPAGSRRERGVVHSSSCCVEN